MTHRAGMYGLLLALCTIAVAGDHAEPMPPDTLRVCADPNNLPFSSEARTGFENRLAERLGSALHTRLEYVWWAQRRGFLRSTLDAYKCDVVMGVPSSLERVLTTRPYYRSSYVFVSRRDRHLTLRSLNDSALRALSIGVQVIGDDYANSPPAHALAARGLSANLRGYSVYGDYREPNPPARIIDAVVAKQVDVAIVWGPLAGYAAHLMRDSLDVVPVLPRIDSPYLPFVFDIAVGVRRGDSTLVARLDDALVKQRPYIDSLLASYGVPRLDFIRAGEMR